MTTPSNSEPTLGEVLRRLDDVSRQMTELAREMKADRAEAAATYVRQDVYVAQRQAMEAMVADLHGDVKKVNTDLGLKIQATKDDLGREVKTIKDDRKTDVAFRRQAWLTMGALAVTTVVTIVVTLVNLLTR